MKSTEILHVFGPKFFFWGGELPEFLESIYKIDAGSDHVAKFRGDRPRELGDYALKKKRNITSILCPPVTTYGRPNIFPGQCRDIVQQQNGLQSFDCAYLQYQQDMR